MLITSNNLLEGFIANIIVTPNKKQGNHPSLNVLNDSLENLIINRCYHPFMHT